MDNYYTYLIFDPRNNKPFYVGKGIKRRMTYHERQTRRGKIPNNNKFLFNKIKKILSLGMSLKYKQSVKNVSEDIAFEWETKFIKRLREKGYELCNISNGGLATRGNLGKKHSDEAKRKMSELRKGNFSLLWFVEKYGNEEGVRLYKERSKVLSKSALGRIPLLPITEETRHKLVISHIGKKQSPETIRKRSLAMKGKGVGRVVSEESRQRMSIKRKGMQSPMLGKIHSVESRIKMKKSHVKQYTFLSPTNCVVNVNCLKDFCEQNNLNYGNMNSVSTGRRQSCQGWKLPL